MESFLIWSAVIAVCGSILGTYVVRETRRNRLDAARRAEAVQLGSDRPAAQYPLIDEGRCIGCAACVAACPEKDVLAIVNGRAVIVNGLRCVGHGRCSEACPVNAIQVGLGEVGLRDDIPQLSPDLETNLPGVYIIGELSGFALIRNAVIQGEQVVEGIVRTLNGAASAPPNPASGNGSVRDLIVVGAGPSGLTAALTARKHGLSAVVLEQEQTGGTILQYPRKKVVLTRAVDIPLWGRLDREEYTKEELLAIWRDAATRNQLDIRTGEKLETIERMPDGNWSVLTSSGRWVGHRVVLALGRRGIPRKLEVPGEQLPKVAYKLIDAESFQDNHVLVVGGGDSAVEAALGLARQSGSTVTLSYRKEKLFRIKKRNEERFATALAAGEVNAVFSSEVVDILPDRVRLSQGERQIELPNEYVFIFAGGEPPYPLLHKIGIAFGRSDGPAAGEAIG